MPTFKGYERRQTIPGVSGGVRGSVAAAGREGEAISAVGREIGEISDIVAVQQERIRAQDRQNKALTIKASYNDRQRAFKSQEFQFTGQDTFDNITRADEFTTKTTEELLKDIDDEELKADLQAHIFSKSQSLKDSLAVHQMGQRKVVTKTASDNILNGLLKDSYDGGELNTQLEDWANTIRDQHSVGLLGVEDAEEQVVTGHSQITEAYIDGLISRDPVMATEAIRSGKFDPYLPQEKIEEYDKKADTLSKALANDLKAQKKEAERVAEKQKKEMQAATGNEFLEKVLNGELTEAEVLASKLDPTGENSKRYWVDQIKERGKKSTKEEWITDPEIEADFLTRITENPDGVPESEILSAQGAGLGTATAKELINYRTRRIKGDDDPLKTEEAKAAVSRLRDAKTAKVWSSNKVDNSKQWAESTVLLKRFIQNHPDEDPQDFVDQLLEPAKDSFVRRILSGIAPVEFQTEEERRGELEEEAGGVAVPEQPAGPTLEEWLPQARLANPGVSDDELTTYFNDKYGGQ